MSGRRMHRGRRWVFSLVLAGLTGLVCAAPARADGWGELRQSGLTGAVYASGSGDGIFLVACSADESIVQANFPSGSKARPGKTGSLAFAVDGKRFTYSGKVMATETGDGKVLMAPAKASDPLVRALGTGKTLRVGTGRQAYDIPLAGAASALSAYLSACGTKPRAPARTAAAAPEPAAASAAQASAQTPAPASPQAQAATRPQTPALTPAQTQAEARAQAEAQKPMARGLPSRAAMADAIFVDKQEGRRLAGKLQVTPIDLNGDGADEAIVIVKDPGWCSENGCTLFVVDFTGGTPRTVGEFIGTTLVPEKTRTGDWRDLTLRAPNGREIQNFKDGRYR